MARSSALPLFHLYGDPPDDQAFDFIHIETISSRSSIHDWTIRAHRHRNLFQILLIVRGGGEMTFEAQAIGFDAPAAIIIPATIAHGFRFRADATEGWVLTFTEDVAHLAASRARTGAATLKPADPTVDALRYLVEEHFRRERQLSFYAGKLAMTPDRLNDHVKRAAGVTAGHLIRQRVLTEAKRQLVFTNQPINEIAYDLTFADPSHFARFFRKQTGTTPQAFREQGGDSGSNGIAASAAHKPCEVAAATKRIGGCRGSLP